MFHFPQAAIIFLSTCGIWKLKTTPIGGKTCFLLYFLIAVYCIKSVYFVAVGNLGPPINLMCLCSDYERSLEHLLKGDGPLQDAAAPGEKLKRLASTPYVTLCKK